MWCFWTGLLTHASIHMNKAKVLVSHHISLNNTAIALKQCPNFNGGEIFAYFRENQNFIILRTNRSNPSRTLPELIIRGAISNVANKELLGVSPALPFVVTQLHLLRCFHDSRCFHIMRSPTSTMRSKARFQEKLIDLCSITLPSFFCHENHVFHSGCELPLVMRIQSPCGQTWTSH